MKKPKIITSDPPIKSPSWQSIVSYVIIFIGQVFVYLPTLTTKYLRPDDYYYLYASISHSEKYITMAIAQGRLFNILHYYFFLLIGSINSMWIVRAVSLFGVILLAFCIFHMLRKYGENIFLSALFALLITLTPAFQETITFAVMYLTPWGAVVAYLAFLSLERSLGKQKLPRLAWSILAIFLMIIAYNIFPPSATFITVYICIFFLYSTSQRKFYQTFYFLFMSGLGMVLHYFIYKGYLILLHIAPLVRTTLVSNPIEKFIWFISEPMVKALNLTNLPPANIVISLIILVIIGTGLALQSKTKKESILLNFIFLLFFILFSYSSNLIVAENIASHRTLSALTGILAIMFILGIKKFFSFIKTEDVKQKTYYIVFGTITIVSIIFAFISVKNIIIPYKKVLSEMRLALANFDNKDYQRIVLSYNNDEEHKQATIHKYYPDLIHIILHERQLSEKIPITIEKTVFPKPTDYIIEIRDLTPTTGKDQAISAEYAHE